MAKDFHVSAPHSLPQSDAQRRIQLLLSETQAMLADPSPDADGQWDGNECRFRLKLGIFPLTGSIKVQPSAVDVRGRLPWGVRRYSERVEKVIAERLQALLADSSPPPSDPPPKPPPFRIV